MTEPAQPAIEDEAPSALTPTALTPRPHTPPQMDWYLDGERHDPAVIAELNGTALYSTPGFDRAGETVLRSFTSLGDLRAHLAAAFEERGTSDPDSLSPVSRYFSDAELQGDVLQNNPGRAWSDLTRVSHGFLGFGNWNDIISSMDWCRWDVSLYEHINYGGSQLYLRAGRTYGNLTAFGWNDRASATVNWGRRF